MGLGREAGATQRGARETMEVIKKLAQSRKFWLAVVALAQTVLFQYVPDFPPELWQKINEVLIVLIAAIAVEDAARHIANGKK